MYLTWQQDFHQMDIARIYTAKMGILIIAYDNIWKSKVEANAQKRVYRFSAQYCSRIMRCRCKVRFNWPLTQNIPNSLTGGFRWLTLFDWIVYWQPLMLATLISRCTSITVLAFAVLYTYISSFTLFACWNWMFLICV